MNDEMTKVYLTESEIALLRDLVFAVSFGYRVECAEVKKQEFRKLSKALTQAIQQERKADIHI